MINKIKIWVFLVITSLFLSYMPPVYAHPGRTASDGCHYCRTNCSKWGEVQDARHCHGGGSAAPAPTYTPPVNTAPAVPSCPSNSYYSSSDGSCICNVGYAKSLDSTYCIKIPPHAHEATSTTNVWECDYGYEEENNSCVLKPEKESPKVVESTNIMEKPSPTTTTVSQNSSNSTTEAAPNPTQEDDDDFAYGMLTLLGGGYYGYKKFKQARGVNNE